MTDLTSDDTYEKRNPGYQIVSTRDLVTLVPSSSERLPSSDGVTKLRHFYDEVYSLVYL